MQGRKTETRISLSDRRWALFGPIAVAVFGVILAVFGGIVPHLDVFYVVGVAFTSISLVFFIGRMTGTTYAVRRIRVRVGALAVVVVLTAAVIVVPWVVAEQRRAVDAIWTGAAELNEEDEIRTLVANGRLLLQDSSSLRAIDLDAGQEMWSVDRGGFTKAFYLSDDGHVLLIGSRGATWLSPDGEELWIREGAETVYPYSDRARENPKWEAVAAHHGTLVARRCDRMGQNAECTFRGIDSDGEVRYEFDAPFVGDYYMSGVSALTLRSYQSQTTPTVLPSVFLTSDEEHQDVNIMAAESGQQIGSTGVPPNSYQMWLDGESLLQQGEEVSWSECQTTATGVDGERLWQTAIPCFDSMVSVFVSGRLYALTSELGDSSAVMTMVNARTGQAPEYPGPASSIEDPSGRPYVPLGPTVLVRWNDEHVFGLDTGARQWRRELAGQAQSRLLHRDRTLIVDDGSRRLNAFVGEEETTVTLIETESGETTGSFSLEEDSKIWPVGTGQALVWQDGQLALIGGRD